ncbi:MAG TPA: HAMP domain-containing sensor histidine kinase [Candidatus Limiplasma sp.]|nr:HAMP domain-containing sensor histidine kinase [Candidatus Limiplasma sp.]HPS82058.1 HAMP domain-containing sensor histidine kinase [Candidatus Limiplasma sp.]
MIQKLRKKLIIVLMAVVCLFLIGILVSLFITSKSEFERRSYSSFREPPAHAGDVQAPPDENRIDMPIAMGKQSADGTVTIEQNQIYYVTDAELVSIIQTLSASAEDNGLTSQYDLRYRRHTGTDGSITYFFSDTYMERNSLNAQLLYSCIIGLGAIGLFFLVSMLLSRWMVKPVEQAWEKQRQFVADASHELKTPLTVVLSNTDMMISSHAVTDEKNRIRLDNIRAESQRMKLLVENLLTLARADSKPALTTREPVNFSFVVTGATLTLEPAIFDLGRTVDCQADESFTVLGDGDKLRQLVDILLDNACKYGNAGSSIRVRVSALGKKEVLLTVASEGAPLPPEECLNIFERFYRSDKSRGQEKGYGLGLAIAQSIVREHGGKIWAQSDGVSVNTFYVKLPCVEAPAAISEPLS